MEAVFLKTVNMGLTASWLVLAVILLRFVFKKAPKWLMCLLWAFVGLKLVFPFSIESVFSLIPSAEPLPGDIMISNTPGIDSGFEGINQAVNPVIQDYLAPDLGASINPMQVVGFICTVLWLVGIAAMLIYTLISYLRIKSRVNEAIILKENIFLCDRIDTPFILGLISPKIYLPSAIDQADIDFVAAHEKAHLKRRDHLWKPLGFLLLSVYWFNPLLWLAYILLCRDIELACDEKVINEMGEDIKKGYSTALINCSVSRKSIAACPLAFGETGIKERVKSILSYKKPAFWVIIAAVAAIIITALCLLTSPKGDTPKSIQYSTKYTDFEGVNIDVIQVEADDERTVLRAQWQNFTPYEITYGNGYTIERKKGSEWINCQIPEEFTINAIAYLQKTNTMQDKIYNLTGLFDITETGTYRIRATCYVQNGESPTECEVWAEFVVAEADLESFVKEKILEVNGRPYNKENYPGIDIKILKTEKSGNKTKLYMWVIYQEYSYKNGQLAQENGFNGPKTITVENTKNQYKLLRYWEPEDGVNYIEDIHDEFPFYLWHTVNGGAHINTEQLFENILHGAQEYFGTNAEPMTLFEEFSTTTVSPNTVEPVFSEIKLSRNLDINKDLYKSAYESGLLSADGKLYAKFNYKGMGIYSHEIKIPQLNINTANAQAFNKKIFAKYKEDYETVLNNNDTEIHYINYEYSFVNNILGIWVHDYDVPIEGGALLLEDFYYYDFNAATEITMEQYMAMLNVTESELRANAEATEYFKENLLNYGVELEDLTGCMISEKNAALRFETDSELGYTVIMVDL